MASPLEVITSQLKDAGSLAQLFLLDNSSREAYRQQYPASRKIRNYILATKILRDDLKCGSNNNCEWYRASEEERAEEDLSNVILCISCDRIFHWRCTGTDIINLTESQLPWICHICTTNPLNMDAQSLVSSDKFKLSFENRINQLIRYEITSEEESIDEGKDSVEKTVHVGADGNILPQQVVDSINALKAKCASMEKENQQLKKMMLNNSNKVNESSARKVAIDKNVNAVTDAGISANISFTDAVFKANAVSTCIDEATKNVADFNKTFSFHSFAGKNSTIPPAQQWNNLTFPTSSTSPQEATIQHIGLLTLNEIRRNLPKIESFDGKPEKWLTFQRAVERNWKEGKYSDEMMKLHIRQALTGSALARVDGLVDLMSASQIMQYLKESFGNTSIVVENARQKLFNVKLSRPLTHASCIEVTTLIVNYMTACTYANILAADSSLSSKIHNQLEAFHQQRYYEFYFRKYPNATMRTERLDVQLEFLNELSRTLPIGNFVKSEDNRSHKNKTNNYQVMTASINHQSNSANGYSNKSSINDNEAYKYEIRDREIARYLGYDMSKVKEIPRKCEFCARANHFSVECSIFKGMKMDMRYNQVKSKGLCMNCLLTTCHLAKDCQIKQGCGYKIDKNIRCTAKHHVSLHRGNNYNGTSTSKNVYQNQRRRARSNQNAARASEKIQQHIQHKQVANINTATIPQQSTAANSSNDSSTKSVIQGYPVTEPVTVSTITQSNVKPYQIFSLTSQLCHVNESSQRTVKLFKTIFYGKSNKAIGYAIGDSAAEITLVKRELVDDLGISGELCELSLQWTDSAVKRTEALRVKLRIAGVYSDSEEIELDECYAVKDLNLPPRSLNVEQLKQQFPHLKDVPFASYKNAIPSLLIGSRHAFMIEAIEPVIQGGSNKPIAIKSKLGYTIYGGAPECFNKNYSVNNNQLGQGDEIVGDQLITNEQLDKLYTFSCSIESLGIKPKSFHLTKDEMKAMEIIEEEIKNLPDGSVELPLVWNRDDEKQIPSLPNNFPMVYKRQLAQENKLKKSPELLEAYNKNFIELINENYVRPASETDIQTDWPNIWYLPMSLVVNNNKVPVKTRNVYDASAIYKGTSLNDKLLMGPNLLVEMLGPLMRMRMFIYAFTGDVKSMFHRIKICERDQQCQRILWRSNLDDKMQIYIQQVMLFGPKCSPFCSQIVKNKTADKWIGRYPNATRALKEFVYMDDLLSSEPTIEQAIATSSQCIEILKSINWKLIGFQSNCIDVLRALNKDHVKQDTIDIMTTDEMSYTTKVLGVAWNPKIDAFVFQLNKNAFITLVKECGHKPSKRDQCSTIARIFDIMGFISHCTIRGKILLQRSWKQKLDWDDEISDEQHAEWLKFLNELERVSSLKIPRLRFNSFNMSDAEHLELHVFCDAGKEAFAAVAYFVAKINNKIYTSFVMSRAKVTPIKIKTKTEVSEMPRLEMMASLLAARLAHTIMSFHKDFNIQLCMWSDSEIVLNWLKNENIKLPKFAVSPIEEVLELTSSDQWNYVDSKNNPADIATKFQKFNFGDINSVWFQGPSFLKLSQEYWPKQKTRNNSNESFLIASINQEAIAVNSDIKLPPIDCPLASDLIIDLLPASITSRWMKLVRAVGRALKFYYNAIIPLLKTKQWNNKDARMLIKQNNNFESLTPMEIERAELFIIRRIQKDQFPVEYERLRANKRISCKKLLELNVFMDSNGIMRISSRVDLPKSTYAQKLAPLVPQKSVFSTALLFHYHYKHNHVGIETQIADFRSKYWMIGVRQSFNRIKSLCNYCGFRRAKPVEYKMSSLPNFRVDSNLEAFQVTGLDCAGPFVVYARNGHAKKVWILIFTCTKTRYIHLHLLDNLSTIGVLEAIVSFWTCYGPVMQFISDNGTNFVGAANVIKDDQIKLIKFLKDSGKELESMLAEKYYASWTFIPVQSPWFGAFYERLIQTVKKSISSAIADKKISRIEFNIALQEAAHRINCRPLTHNPISSDNDPILTPHELVKFKQGWPFMPSTHANKSLPSPLQDRDQFRRGRALAEELARKFVLHYLPVLTKRTKWFTEFPPIKVNDLVLSIDPNENMKNWKRAKVLKIYKGRDGKSRVVDLLFPDGTVKKNRSVHRLAKLDIKSL